MATHRMMQSAEYQTSQWREVREIEQSITEICEWFAFAQGAQFAGRPLPVAVHRQTKDRVLTLLTAELVRLTNSPA
jgi:hypothetical protein